MVYPLKTEVGARWCRLQAIAVTFGGATQTLTEPRRVRAGDRLVAVVGEEDLPVFVNCSLKPCRARSTSGFKSLSLGITQLPCHFTIVFTQHGFSLLHGHTFPTLAAGEDLTILVPPYELLVVLPTDALRFRAVGQVDVQIHRDPVRAVIHHECTDLGA